MGRRLYKNNQLLSLYIRKEPVTPALFLFNLDDSCFLQGGEGAILLDVAHALG